MKHKSLIALAFSASISLAQIDTIDLNSEKDTPPPHTQGETQLIQSSNTLTANSYPSTWEIGLGYIYGNFSAEQSLTTSYTTHTTKGNSSGFELFAQVNMYLKKNAGVTFGVGLEYLPI